MKLLSVQMAIFSEDIISRPDLLFDEVNKSVGNIIDDMPNIINLPPEAPAEIPIVQSNSKDGHFKINVSRSRIDLFLNFGIGNNNTPQETLTSEENILEKFYQSVLSIIAVNRAGLIITMFSPRSDNVKAIYGKYFSEKYDNKIVEASMRINKQIVKSAVTYNNIRAIEAVTLNIGNEEVDGVLFQFDINNVVVPGKRIDKNIVLYILSKGKEYISNRSVEVMI